MHMNYIILSIVCVTIQINTKDNVVRLYYIIIISYRITSSLINSLTTNSN